MRTGLMAVITSEGLYYQGSKKGQAVWTSLRCDAKWTSRLGALRILNNHRYEARSLRLVSIND